MNVRLISYTQDPVMVGGTASRCCTSEDMPDDFDVAKNEKALQHAMDSGHHSVAEHIVFTFAIEGISRACSHQLVRHRMASYSQQSQRYVNQQDFGYIVPESIRNCVWEYFDEDCGERVDGPFDTRYHSLMCDIADVYMDMIHAGVPEEDARYILPNACTTNIVMTVNLRELIHIAELRLCQRAQWEIRELVEKMVECVIDENRMFAKWLVPQCQRLGYCPEKKSCGRMARK